ncbi:MAG TPA: type VI secretion system ATPase TssH, partial [Candidatus Caccomorpha excrementavium]|nr:type VI secretion system ATPase TssH [Candidatus Caccomorpha excrementavium]
EGIEEDGEISRSCEEMVMTDLRNHFRPEFLNRLDEIIMFKPLTMENIGGIMDLLIEELNGRLADKEITIELTQAAREYIAKQAYDPAYGARPLKRYLQKNVETLSARMILSDQVHTEDTIVIDVQDGKLTATVRVAPDSSEEE